MGDLIELDNADSPTQDMEEAVPQISPTKRSRSASNDQIVLSDLQSEVTRLQQKISNDYTSFSVSIPGSSHSVDTVSIVWRKILLVFLFPCCFATHQIQKCLRSAFTSIDVIID